MHTSFLGRIRESKKRKRELEATIEVLKAMSFFVQASGPRTSRR